MDKTNRSSRTSTVRDTRKKQWMPPSSLDAPPAPNGYKHRWIRTETMGQDDTANVSKRRREGWEFVRAEEIKNQIGEHDYPVISEGKFQGLIGVGGLVLARIPEEIVEQRKNYFKDKTSDQMKAVDNDILREQRPEMPINVDRQSRVTFGGGRKT
tara:strand:+ start:2267 stop:2731 length:465 start_codon:yes stop_codon:yes gene_type:complete